MRTMIIGAALNIAIVASAANARAEECGNVSEEGVCQDPKTLLYCKDGELKTMVCGEDEICVQHDFFQGNAGCVHTRYTGCGDIPEAGICVGDRLLRYCDNDVVQERTCDDGWSCDVVAGEDGDPGYYDCVPQQGIGPASPEDEGAEVDPPELIGAEDSAELEPRYGNTDNARPSIEKGGAAAAGEQAGGGAGCNGAAVGASVWLALAMLGLRRARRV